MDRHELAAIEDANRVEQLMRLNERPRPVWHAVVIAVDQHEAVFADVPFQLEQNTEGLGGPRLQFALLDGKGSRDNPLRGAEQTNVGDGIKLGPRLSVQIVEVTKRADQ